MMRKALVITGILVFLLGVWFDFGAFVSGDPDLKPTWESFIIPATINAIGVAMIVLGIKQRSKVQSSISDEPYR